MSNNIEHKNFWDEKFKERFSKFLNEPPPKVEKKKQINKNHKKSKNDRS